MRRRVLLGLLLACTVAGFSQTAGADEATDGSDVSALARERLAAQARQMVQGGALAALAPARESLATVREAARQDWDAGAVDGTPLGARLTWLLGLDEGAADPSTAGGALLEVVLWNLWLAGEEAGGRYAWRARADGGEAPAPEFLDPAAWEALEGAERDRLLRDSVLDLARLGDGGREPSGHIDLAVAPSAADPLARLRAPPALEHVSVLLHADELADEISESWVRVRDLQVQAHLQAWGKEKPSQLITEGEMARHGQRVDAARAELQRIETRATGVLAALDRMVAMDMEISRRLFLHDQELEAGTKEGDAGEARPELARLRLEETSLRLEQQLLYLAVVRAEHRLSLYERARKLIQQETVAAEAVRDRFLQRVRRTRRELQLGQLAHDRGWLEASRRQALELASKGGEADRDAWEAYVGILADLVRMTDLLAELLECRKSLEMRVAIDAEEGEGEAGASDSSEAPPDAPTPPSADADTAPPSHPSTEPGRPEGLGTLLEPARFVHRPGFISAIRAALDDPRFDGELVAKTYAAVDDYIRQRRASVAASSGAEDVLAGYEALGETLPPRLEAVEAKLPAYMAWDVRQIRERGRPYADIRDRTMAGIREEREQARQQIAQREALLRELRGLGERSLKIRADRSLDAEGLGAGAESVHDGVQTALRWLTLREAPHLGTFLSSHWPQVLVVLFLAGVVAAVVSIGRRRIDRTLARIGRATPAFLSEEITVGNEAAEARAVRQHEQDAVEEAETATLRETSQEDAEEEEAGPASTAPEPTSKTDDGKETR